MFIKLTSSGPRRYAQLVESFRDETGRPRQRTLATLGRVDKPGELDGLINALLRATGGTELAAVPAAAVEFESALALGDVWSLSQLWGELGFDDLGRVLRRTRHDIDVLALLRVMVFHRLCDAGSKLGVLRWLPTVALPDVDAAAVTHQHLLRAMDVLEAERDAKPHCRRCCARSSTRTCRSSSTISRPWASRATPNSTATCALSVAVNPASSSGSSH